MSVVSPIVQQAIINGIRGLAMFWKYGPPLHWEQTNSAETNNSRDVVATAKSRFMYDRAGRFLSFSVKKKFW